MPITYKVLGQVIPAAATNTTLYTCSANSTVCSTLVACNQGPTTNYRVAIRPSGNTLANVHYIIFDNYINQYDSIFLTMGFTLANTDVVTVYANTANVSFSLFGAENT